MRLCGRFENSGEKAVGINKRTYTGKRIEKTEETAFYTVGENENYILSLNTANSDFCIENKKSGYKWFSVPQDAENDPVAYGIYSMELRSSLIVDYVITSNDEVNKFNSYTGSVVDGNFEIYQLDNGFRVDYFFSEFKLTLPLAVFLDEKSVTAEVLLDEIKSEKEDLNITDIAVLPFFGAGKTGSDGYIFVPDGSGAIIEFDNGKSACEEYSSKVYGDSIYEKEGKYNKSTDNQSVKFPVFGLKNNSESYFAIIENGAEFASIKARTNNLLTSYATAYASFNLKDSIYYTVGVSSSGIVESRIYEKADYGIDRLSVKYSFLDEAANGYSDMAALYRTYLTENGMLPEKNTESFACGFDIYGGITKRVSVMGIQYDKVVPLTTADEVKTLVGLMRKAGIDNTVIKYSYWNEDALAGKIPTDADCDGVLEDEISFEELFRLKNVRFYPNIENLLTFSKGNGLDKYFSTAADLTGVSYKIKNYSVSIGKESGKAGYLISYDALPEKIKAFGKEFSDAGIGNIALSDVGRFLYNDYSDGSVKRVHVKNAIDTAISKLKFKQINFDNPNVYALKYASDLSNVSINSSGSALIDYDVPFYQMTVSGTVRCFSEPINISSLGDNVLLKLIENATMPDFAVIYRDTSLLYNTELTKLYGSEHSACIKKASEIYGALKEFYEKIGDFKLASHEKIEKDVYKISFQNGKGAYINYSDRDVTVDGVTVKAKNYQVKE